MKTSAWSALSVPGGYLIATPDGRTLIAEWARARRQGKPISLVMVDVDYFKSYNDYYGHLAGDECLKSLAVPLKECAMRSSDMAARFGGEEFMILMPATNAAGAASVAENLRWRIEQLKIPHELSSVSRYVTISAGVFTCIPSRDQTPVEAIAATDRLLYQAKREGRNRIKTAAGKTAPASEPCIPYPFECELSVK